jgi:2-polyprenyl-3-methyl-5-hydroxy-6-metoxy-1,4-benzoquinol methylase
MTHSPRLSQDSRAGFWYVDPPPSLEDLEDFYKHEFYSKEKPLYLEKTQREKDYWQAWWQLRLQHMAVTLGGAGKILDIGASGGFFLDCARKQGWQVSGVEPATQAATHARDQLDIDVFEGNFEAYQAPAGSFDAIHLSFVLEHVPNPRQFLQKAIHLLREGGCLWVEVPNDFNVLQETIVSRLAKGRWWIVPEHHLNYFEYNSLAALMQEIGVPERYRMSSFPMELFVLMGDDYIGNDAVGRECHSKRMRFEQHLLAYSPEILAQIYESLAEAGLGRTCNIMGIKTSVD